MDADTSSSTNFRDNILTRSETEFSIGWMEQNPELFIKRFLEFRSSYPVEDFIHNISFHNKGSIKVIAHRRDKPFDAKEDYLKEIGMK